MTSVFRIGWRPLLAALTLAAVGLGGEARAAFSLQLKASNTVNVSDNQAGVDTNGALNTISLATPFTGVTGYEITAQVSSIFTPGNPAKIEQSILTVTNKSATTALTVTSTSTGVAGFGPSSVITALTYLTIPASGSVTGQSVVNGVTLPSVTVSSFPGLSRTDGLVLPGTYDFSNVATFNLAIGQTVSIQSSTIITSAVPVPPTAVALAAGLPLLGGLRLLRRRTPAVA
jgi:hypothetical protein